MSTETVSLPRLQLAFGWDRGLVPGVSAAWGARAICTQDGLVDLVVATSAAGDPELVTKTIDWLNSAPANDARGAVTVLGRALKVASAMLESRHLDTRKAGGAVIHQDRMGAVIADTQGSAGYLYVAAYLFEALPQGHGTKGLEIALRSPSDPPM